MIEGVDYADARPSPAGLVAAGKRFVVRYGGPGRDAKQLHADELRALLAAGLSVVANAEGTTGGFQGEAAGRAWAVSAEQHFRDLGMPADRPIYFSVDTGSPDLAAVDAACRGAAAVIGAGRVGVYGGYATIAHVARAGTARWFWQTYGWSAGRWWPGAHIQQYRNGVTVAGGDCDLNRAMVDDFGQWGQEDDVTPDDIAAIADAVWAKTLRNPYSNVDQPASDLLRYAPSRTPTLQVGDKVDALAGQVSAVQTALAGLTPALLGALVPAIVAALPSGVSVTEEQLAAALVAALKQLAAPAA